MQLCMRVWISVKNMRQKSSASAHNIHSRRIFIHSLRTLVERGPVYIPSSVREMAFEHVCQMAPCVYHWGLFLTTTMTTANGPHVEQSCCRGAVWGYRGVQPQYFFSVNPSVGM